MTSPFGLYLQLGFEHITDLQGYDHMLFILALCAVYQLSEWRKVAILVTAFTIGHSITLALTALEVIKVSSTWIEFLVPVTIFITALYNLLAYPAHQSAQQSTMNSTIQWNYGFALFFGLIHGMAFSNFFRSALLPGEEGQLIIQLLAFNIGVELGQLMIVAIILLISYVVMNRLSVKQQIWKWIISLPAAAIALFMAITRIPL